MLAEWPVKEVMEYFGEWIGDEYIADMLTEVGCKGKTIYHIMSEVRDKLIAQGHDVPFRWDYRRIKG